MKPFALRCGMKLLPGHRSLSRKNDAAVEKKRAGPRAPFGISRRSRGRPTRGSKTTDPSTTIHTDSDLTQSFAQDDKTADLSMESDPLTISIEGKVGKGQTPKSNENLPAMDQDPSKVDQILEMLYDSGEDFILEVHDESSRKVTTPSVKERGLKSVSEEVHLGCQAHEAAATVTMAFRLYRAYRLAHKQREHEENKAAGLVTGALAVNRAKNVLIKMRQSKESLQYEKIVRTLMYYRDRSEYLKKKRCSLVISSAIRVFLSRKRKETQAATIVTNAMRRYRQKKLRSLMAERAAALTITTAFIIYRTKIVLAKKRLEDERQNRAAQVIVRAMVANATKNKARQELEQQNHAAKIIARVFFASAARKKALIDLDQRKEAAIVIARAFTMNRVKRMKTPIIGLATKEIGEPKASCRLSSFLTPSKNSIGAKNDHLDETVRKIS